MRLQHHRLDPRVARLASPRLLRKSRLSGEVQTGTWKLEKGRAGERDGEMERNEKRDEGDGKELKMAQGFVSCGKKVFVFYSCFIFLCSLIPTASFFSPPSPFPTLFFSLFPVVFSTPSFS
jgi:hypothetical protein